MLAARARQRAGVWHLASLTPAVILGTHLPSYRHEPSAPIAAVLPITILKKIVNTVLLLLRKNDSTATGAPFLTAAVLANASPGSPSDVDLVKSVKPLIIQVTGAQQPFLKCHSR